MKIGTNRITVLVTAVGGRSVGYQIIECLKKYPENYRIIATDADPFAPGLYEAYKSYLLPPSSTSAYIKELIKICKKEKVQVVLPGSIPETLVISQNQEELIKNNIIPIVNSKKLVEETYDKLDVYHLLKQNGLLTPKTTELRSIDDAKDFSYPMIIKPRGGSSGSRNVHILKDKNELIEIYEKLSKENVHLLAQEYVGEEDEEYTVGVMASRDGRIIDTIVMRRKLIGLSRGEERNINGRDYVLSTGYSQGFLVDQPDVKKYCEYAAKKLGARGPFNIQCRRGEKGVYVFEVHPRFSGSASIRAEVGFNEPHFLIQDFLGVERVKRVPHKLGFAIIRKFANTVVPMEEYKKMLKEKSI